jgi:POT family proton-dependent oligopeptide transporter
MRSLVMALFMGTGAMSAVLGEGFLCTSACLRLSTYTADTYTGLAADPLLVWNYAVMGVLAGGGGCAFWLAVRQLDAGEDEMDVSKAGGAVDDVVDLEEAEGS